jgi:hypothetical protein
MSWDRSYMAAFLVTDAFRDNLRKLLKLDYKITKLRLYLAEHFWSVKPVL